MNRTVEDAAFGERPAVVRARRADRMDLARIADEHDGFTARMTEERYAIAKLAISDALIEVGSRELCLASHAR
jgi:hypothetical protein